MAYKRVPLTQPVFKLMELEHDFTWITTMVEKTREELRNYNYGEAKIKLELLLDRLYEINESFNPKD